MEFKSQPWYQFLDEGMRDLVNQAYSLLEREKRLSVAAGRLVSASGGAHRNRITKLASQPQPPDEFVISLAPATDSPYHDYSFIVFPMAKAYEGFLKKWFFQTGFIKEYQYNSDHFRIGKALNPSLPARFKRDGYVYDKIVAACPDPHLADTLWQAWKQSRNLTFHYFPHHRYFLTLSEARARLAQLATAMKSALECQVLQGKIDNR